MITTIQCQRQRCFLLVQFLFMAVPSAARSWVDIVMPSDLKLHDYHMGYAMTEEDPFLAIETATEPPLPSSPGSGSPIASPSASIPPTPTNIFLTPQPTAEATTTQPTKLPTLAPTELVTPAPTRDPYPENPVPDFPGVSYFNYDSNDIFYGPGTPELQRYNKTTLIVGYKNNGWASTGVDNDFYWNEFDDEKGYGPWQGVLSVRNPERNRCANIGEQSPIDLRPSGAKCVEHHQIRARPGDFKVNSQEVEKQIHPNKLRLKFQRRPCSDMENPECDEPDPPHADFPNNWGGYADAMHIDFKVPSEHMIEGRRYDAEMQIFHLHPSRRRTPTVSVLIQATPNGYNYYLQPALDAFQYQYNVHRAQCAAKRRKERQLVTDVHQVLGTVYNESDSDATDYSTWAEYSTDLDDPEFEEKHSEQKRKLQFGVWDPHNIQLVPSIYFYGYEGSLTEPPCGEWVTWFVCDTQMIVSNAQLEQMKKLIFTHIDGDCNPTSVHYRQSVARPIQDTAGRPVWHCTQDDFLADNA